MARERLVEGGERSPLMGSQGDLDLLIQPGMTANGGLTEHDEAAGENIRAFNRDGYGTP